MSENNDGVVNEKQLWHGTGESILEKICMQNFDWRLVTTHAYGKGSYFARDASFSSGYTSCNANGISAMFFADVLVGLSVKVSLLFYKERETLLIIFFFHVALIYDFLIDNFRALKNNLFFKTFLICLHLEDSL